MGCRCLDSCSRKNAKREYSVARAALSHKSILLLEKGAVPNSAYYLGKTWLGAIAIYGPFAAEC